MTTKIIRKGTIPLYIYRGTCPNCDTEFETDDAKTDTYIGAALIKRTEYLATCPLCDKRVRTTRTRIN